MYYLDYTHLNHTDVLTILGTVYLTTTTLYLIAILVVCRNLSTIHTDLAGLTDIIGFSLERLDKNMMTIYVETCKKQTNDSPVRNDDRQQKSPDRTESVSLPCSTKVVRRSAYVNFMSANKSRIQKQRKPGENYHTAAGRLWKSLSSRS